MPPGVPLQLVHDITNIFCNSRQFQKDDKEVGGFNRKVNKKSFRSVS